jgi:8-hydroxy-5-deazaflavin:NADPH oxidoreductase
VRIGIVGSGLIGGTLARALPPLGHQVAIANSRGPESLADLVEKVVGLRAVTVGDAIAFGDMTIIAVPFKAVSGLPTTGTTGKVIVDATNYYERRDGQIAPLIDGKMTSSALLAEHFAGARVVKAFNTMYFTTLAGGGLPDGDPKRLVIFVAGDDADAKASVSSLIDQLGFDTIDTGGLHSGGLLQEPGSPIYNVPLTVEQAEDILAEIR